MSAPAVVQDSSKQAPPTVGEEKPNEVFKRMVINNKNQDANLSKRILNDYGVDGSPKPRAGAKRFQSVRFIICTLGVLSLAMSQMNRMVINICITSMIDPSMLKPKAGASSDGSCFGKLAYNKSSTEQFARMSDETGTATIQEHYTTAFSTFTEQTTTTIISNYEENNFNEAPGWTLSSMDTTTERYDPQETTSLLVKTTTQPSYNLGDGGTTDSSDDTESTGFISTLEPASGDVVITTYDTQTDKFKWTIQQQSILLGGFFWSYFVFMILGGWIAEMYGAKYVLFLGVAGSSIISLFTPLIARTSLTLLVFSRIVMGTLQSGVFPAMYAVIARWLTMSEASIYAPMIKMNLRLGALFGSLLPGLVPSWPNVFYLVGTIGLIWSLLWLFLATSDPSDNKFVSVEELAHITKKKRKKPEALTDTSNKNNDTEMVDMKKTPEKAQQHKKDTKTPWIKIITHPSVIGLIIVKFTANTGLDFLSIELPSYLKYVHHTPTEQISFITTFMFSLQVGLIVFVGWIAKTVVKQSPFGMSKTAVRKMFQSTASFGVGSCLFLITFNDCSLVYVIVLLQFTSILSMFGAGGETMLPYDISDRFPATIMAIANSIANLSALIVTTLTGKILGDEGGSYDRWNVIIYLVAGANFIGGLMFIILVKAEMIDFSSSDKTRQDPEADLQVSKKPAEEVKDNKR